MQQNTIEYYNTHADQYIDKTININLNNLYEHFLMFLPPHGKILDFGCGQGRDTKQFLDLGYEVHALDGSIEMCKYASSYCGIEVKQILFQDYIPQQKYDGVWACASLLHLNRHELIKIIPKLLDSITNKGVIYMSFKYGEFEGYYQNRYFTNFTETSIKEIIGDSAIILKLWTTCDIRKEKSNLKWLNIIIRKNN